MNGDRLPRSGGPARRSRRLALAGMAIAAGVAFPAALADEVRYFADGESGRRLEFGAGADGAFADGAAAPGITVVGAAISIDTDVRSVFEFSSFVLSGGATLTATGARPLVIRVRGPATIAGTIALDGTAGQDANAGGPGAGGAAGAGGGRGGDGGTSGTDGGDGQPATGYSIGGGGGANDITFSTQRAGGGGCNGFGALGGHRFPAGAAVCPAAAAQNAGVFENRFLAAGANARAGGGGGGGGGTDDNVGVNLMHGAGGGGGGGALAITALGDLALSGAITARGGNGGDGALGVNDYGSSGGGGAGGSVWLQTAGRLAGAGSVDVDSGDGGVDSIPANLGGNGSVGVVRFDAGTSAFTGTVAPAGSADRESTVLPVTVGFTLDAGPGCGTLARGGPGGGSARGSPLSLLAPALLLAFFYGVGRISRTARD